MSITTILTSIVTILVSIEQVNTPLIQEKTFLEKMCKKPTIKWHVVNRILASYIKNF